MNVAFNNRPQEAQECIEMIDNPESHCMEFLRSMEDKHTSKFPDPEEIRALTRGMKREHWEVPDSVPRGDKFALARAYLDAFGSFKVEELSRFGIEHLRGFGSHPDIKTERIKNDGGSGTFYSYA